VKGIVKNFPGGICALVVLLSVLLSGVALPVMAQEQTAEPPDMIERLAVIGNERIEAATVASYLTLQAGDLFDPELIDLSLKALFATGLFADVVMERDGNALVIRVVENPVINRVIFEGNSRLDREDLMEEVQLRPRMVYTRARVRADSQRIIELYRRSGRFAAVVEPKIIEREQNRVDLIFEIAEGPKSRVSRINFIGNNLFSDRQLRGELATKEARWWKIFTSDDTYDPDRLQFDRELLRQFYLSNGYADFRVVSAVAELTPDQQDFFITFTVEEGELYYFGEIDVESEIDELSPALFRTFLLMHAGEIYDGSLIEDTIENMTNVAGIMGFAFLDIRPSINRVRTERTLGITFHILEAPRTYVERVVIHGNIRTLDRVIRREFRIAEGDAFNTLRINRSESRLNSLGFFRNVSIEQLPGSHENGVILDVTVEEQATGELSFGLGFSSLENFILNFSIAERNLLGKAQRLRLSATLSSRRKQIDLGFTEPRFLGRNISAGVNLFRREFDSRRESSFATTSTGMAINTAFPVSEYSQVGLRYTLRADNIITRGIFSSPFVVAAQGERTTSSVGYTFAYNTIDNFLRPSTGDRFVLRQDVSGLGGSVKYLRSTIDYDFYRPLPFDFVLHLGAEYGFIFGLGQDVRINDRFFLGGPKLRGFRAAGVGPRDVVTGDFLGGNLFYTATTGVVLPLGRAAEELGVRVNAFVDFGSLAKLDFAGFDIFGNPIDNSNVFSNGSVRISAGIGIMWESPFGPFRIDVTQVIRKEPFDKAEFIQFNVGTVF
jgi:outer membrane protein insertion porin family